MVAGASNRTLHSGAEREKQQHDGAHEHEDGNKDDAEGAKRVGGEAVHGRLTLPLQHARSRAREVRLRGMLRIVKQDESIAHSIPAVLISTSCRDRVRSPWLEKNRR